MIKKMKEKIGKKKIEAAVAIFAVVLALFIVGSVPVMVADPVGGSGQNIFPGPVRVTLKAVDNDSGVNFTMYALDPMLEPIVYTLYTGPFEVPDEGHHIVYFYSVDLAGNVEKVRTVEFDIVLPDTEPPHTTCLLEDVGSGTP